MSADEVRHALRSALPTPVQTVEAIPGGWSSWTFEIDHRWIVRFPRNDPVALRQERERLLLPELSKHVTFDLPIPEFSGTWAGRRFHGYRKLAGRPMAEGDLSALELAGLLRALHSFPTSRARGLLGVPGTIVAWKEHYRALRTEVDTRVMPILGTELAQKVELGFERFFDTPSWPEPTLVHQDLGTEHILIEKGRMGVIDFEYVTVGDPTIDFVGIFVDLGPELAYQVGLAYGDLDPSFWSRLRFYFWMGSVHAILYALETGDEELGRGAMATLAVRIAERPRVCAAVLRGDQILMVRYHDAYWTLPGGGVEPNEPFEDAVVRELREETGVSGIAERALFVQPYSLGVSTCYLVRVTEGEPFLTGDPQVTALAWRPLSELSDDVQVSQVLAHL